MKVNFLFGMACALLVASVLSGCDERKEFVVDETLYLNHLSLDMFYGDRVQVTASPGSGAYEWTSEDNTVARVSSSGLIEATGVGTTGIVVTCGNALKRLPVTVTIPKADKVTGRPGMDRAAVELDIRSTLIKTVRIIRMDTEEVVNFDVDYQTGVFTAYYDNLAEARYSFRIVCIDKYDMESTPTDINVQVYGDLYRSRMTVRQFRVATAFGNGLTIGWGNPVGTFVDVAYTDANGRPAVKRTYANESATCLLDYLPDQLTDFSYTTGYVPEETAVDTFYTAPVTVTAASIGSKRTFLTSGAPATVKACDFDLGGEGVGFHDSDATNSANNYAYRENLGDYNSRGVDVEGGLNLGYTNKDEWLIYTVDVTDAGNYAIDFYLSVNGSGAKCHVEADGAVSATYDLVNNSNWSDWRYYCERNSVAPPTFYLTPGKHKIKFYFESGSFNFNGLRFSPVP